MNYSRRTILRFGATGLAASAFLAPMKLLAKMSSGAPLRKSDIHFTGRHALRRILAQAEDEGWANLPMGDLMGIIGISFLDTPYVNYTLDHAPDHEYCIVNLQALDCVTFVETTLALARMIKIGGKSDSELAAQIELVRYRDGACSGFCSRLHYLSDWFYDNQRKGVVKPYTSSLGGAKKISKDISLMSTRPEQYLELRHHPEFVAEIKKDEEAISARPICYLPKANISLAESEMKTGDIIAITTSAGILDCAHTGLCYRDDKGILRFLHASLTHKKVYLDHALSDYVDKVHAFTGIMVARPAEPV